MFDKAVYAIASVGIVSLISLIGIFTLGIKREKLQKYLLYLVSFSAGAMLGDVFIHLIPGAIKDYGFSLLSGIYVLLGVVAFFVIEKFVHWQHCHAHGEGHYHTFAWMNLVGDSVHNFIDGLIIGASYLVSLPIGFATTIAVVFHEIPQEIGDFGVMLHGGFSRGRALFFNFLTALTAVVGTIAVLAIGRVEGFLAFLIPFAAGSFIYIAGADLIPELHKEVRIWRSLMQLLYFIFGIVVMLSLLLLE